MTIRRQTVAVAEVRIEATGEAEATARIERAAKSVDKVEASTKRAEASTRGAEGATKGWLGKVGDLSEAFDQKLEGSLGRILKGTDRLTGILGAVAGAGALVTLAVAGISAAFKAMSTAEVDNAAHLARLHDNLEAIRAKAQETTAAVNSLASATGGDAIFELSAEDSITAALLAKNLKAANDELAVAQQRIVDFRSTQIATGDTVAEQVLNTFKFESKYLEFQKLRAKLKSDELVDVKALSAVDARSFRRSRAEDFARAVAFDREITGLNKAYDDAREKVADLTLRQEDLNEAVREQFTAGQAVADGYVRAVNAVKTGAIASRAASRGVAAGVSDIAHALSDVEVQSGLAGFALRAELESAEQLAAKLDADFKNFLTSLNGVQPFQFQQVADSVGSSFRLGLSNALAGFGDELDREFGDDTLKSRTDAIAGSFSGAFAQLGRDVSNAAVSAIFFGESFKAGLGGAFKALTQFAGLKALTTLAEALEAAVFTPPLAPPLFKSAALWGVAAVGSGLASNAFGSGGGGASAPTPSSPATPTSPRDFGGGQRGGRGTVTTSVYVNMAIPAGPIGRHNAREVAREIEEIGRGA